jgi:enamine deaminase RidA (YjgF/YER057c/UK114 family)
MMQAEERLRALGLELYDVAARYRVNPSGARFVSHLAVGKMLYLSGTVPIKENAPYLTGVLGADLTIAQGYEAARYALVSALAVIKYALGDLDRVEQAVQLIGYVNSAPGFSQQPRVVNGATDLLQELYGPRGLPTRAAIGCQGLALNSSVEIVLTVLFSGTEVRPPLTR